MKRLLLALLLCNFAPAASASEVRSQGGRFWIECQSASLEEVLREIAEITPIELWLDEGVSGARVSASVEGLTLKAALEELFEDVSVNYVLYSDSSNPEIVTKIYAGSGGDAGRLGREPTVAAAETLEPEEPEEKELPPELDPENLLAAPEAQEALGALREFFEEQKERGEQGEEPSDGFSDEEAPDDLPAELQELLKNIPQFPRSPFTPGLEPKDPDSAPPKEPKKDPKK